MAQSNTPHAGQILRSLRMDRLARDEGQTLAEYALILALVVVVVVAAVALLGGRIADMWSQIQTGLF